MLATRLRAPLALVAFVCAIAVPTAWADDSAEFCLPVPYRSQADGTVWAASNCGPTAIAMVLEAYGFDIPTLKLRQRANQLLGISNPSTGTRIQDLARIVGEYGLSVTGPYEGNRFRRWTLDEVQQEVHDGKPVVAQVYFPLLPNHRENPVATDHYIVIVGTYDGGFIFNDPSDRDQPGYRQKMTADEFTRAWGRSQYPFAGFSVGPGKDGHSLEQPPPSPEANDAGAAQAERARTAPPPQ